jgi:chemotaxis protein CheD
MHHDAAVIDIFLQPGEIYCGGSDTRIRTLLGSCVAITLWHPRGIGAMCHFMLPARRRPQGAAADARYADEALELLLAAMADAGAAAPACEIKLFGGGNMFAPQAVSAARREVSDVAQRNVAAARALLAGRGLALCAEDLGGRGHRQLIFDIGSGAVWVRRPPLNNINDGGSE